jgi:CBS domain-containing protein
MKILDRVTVILARKGTEVWSVPSDATVYAAVETMADRAVGALLVTENGRLVGVVSERDYARKVILQGRSSTDTFVREIMTPDPITVGPCATVNEAMQVMTDNRFRHLPIVDDNGKILGVVSMGDLVNWIISSQDETITQLEHYITSQYPC